MDGNKNKEESTVSQSTDPFGDFDDASLLACLDDNIPPSGTISNAKSKDDDRQSTMLKEVFEGNDSSHVRVHIMEKIMEMKRHLCAIELQCKLCQDPSYLNKYLSKMKDLREVLENMVESFEGSSDCCSEIKSQTCGLVCYYEKKCLDPLALDYFIKEYLLYVHTMNNLLSHLAIHVEYRQCTSEVITHLLTNVHRGNIYLYTLSENVKTHNFKSENVQ